MLLLDAWSGDPMTAIYNIARNLVAVWETERARTVAAPVRRPRTTFTRRTTFGR